MINGTAPPRPIHLSALPADRIGRIRLGLSLVRHLLVSQTTFDSLRVDTDIVRLLHFERDERLAELVAGGLTPEGEMALVGVGPLQVRLAKAKLHELKERRAGVYAVVHRAGSYVGKSEATSLTTIDPNAVFQRLYWHQLDTIPIRVTGVTARLVQHCDPKHRRKNLSTLNYRMHTLDEVSGIHSLWLVSRANGASLMVESGIAGRPSLGRDAMEKGLMKFTEFLLIFWGETQSKGENLKVMQGGIEKWEVDHGQRFDWSGRGAGTNVQVGLEGGHTDLVGELVRGLRPYKFLPSSKLSISAVTVGPAFSDAQMLLPRLYDERYGPFLRGKWARFTVIFDPNQLAPGAIHPPLFPRYNPVGQLLASSIVRRAPIGGFVAVLCEPVDLTIPAVFVEYDRTHRNGDEARERRWAMMLWRLCYAEYVTRRDLPAGTPDDKEYLYEAVYGVQDLYTAPVSERE